VVRTVRRSAAMRGGTPQVAWDDGTPARSSCAGGSLHCLALLQMSPGSSHKPLRSHIPGLTSIDHERTHRHVSLESMPTMPT
jgi:hypothetical protein